MTSTLDGKVILVPPNSQNFHSLTILGKDFCLIYFPKVLPMVITIFICLMCNKQIETVKLPSYYRLLPSVTCLKVENYHL